MPRVGDILRLDNGRTTSLIRDLWRLHGQLLIVCRFPMAVQISSELWWRLGWARIDFISQQCDDYYQEPDQPSPNENKASSEKEGVQDEKKDESPKSKLKITLPIAIEMCVHNNFRVLGGAERIRIAEGDLLSSSLIPNPSLFADYQLIPLPRLLPIVLGDRQRNKQSERSENRAN